MNLVLNDDQRMIREEAARLLSQRSSSERVRQVVDEGRGHDEGLWKTVSAELGWCAMAIPEAYGGLGLGPTELILLMEAVGQRLAALPLWSSACAAAPLLAAVGKDEAKAVLLARIAAGDAATVAWGDIGSIDPLTTPGFSARRDGDNYVLDGRAEQVPDLVAAQIVLVPASLDDRLALFQLPAGSADIRLLGTLDGTRQIGSLTMDNVVLPGSSRVDAHGFTADTADPALAIAQLGLAAEQVGAARGVMDLTLDYIASRVQFGRTIASFQAVKHRCAALEVDLAEARALLYGAAANFGGADIQEQRLEIASARALASDLLFRAAEESIQLHGGVGFTWEYDPHLYFKRAQASAVMLGSAGAQRARIAETLLESEASR